MCHAAATVSTSDRIGPDDSFGGPMAPPTAAAEPQSPRLRVLTYNIHHGEGMDRLFDYERLARIIRDAKPDLVALQEVDNATERSQGVDQATRLGELTKMHAAFGRAMYYSGGQYGEAVLSRFPIIDSRARVLPFRYGQEPRMRVGRTCQAG